MLLWPLKQAFMEKVKVTVVTVVYGTRWPLLCQVADACLADDQVKTFVIVDNGCHDKVLMDAYAANYSGRVVILRQDKNIGYSGAISQGLTFAPPSVTSFLCSTTTLSPKKEPLLIFWPTYVCLAIKKLFW
jgi:Glycosyl transferase family 2